MNDRQDESIEDYVEWPPRKRMLGDEDNAQEDFQISDEDAVLCALSIPEEFVPTPHKQFIKDLAQNESSIYHHQSKTKMPTSERIMIGKRKSPVPIIGDIDVKTESNGEGTPMMKDTDRKLRSAFAKYKKLDEADRCKIEKLGDNKILVNGSLVVERDYENYTKESDVPLEMDEDWKSCWMPPLPTPTAPNCQAPPCRLGCVCDSIVQDSIARTHCGKPKCFYECSCQLAVFPNGDDGDIRSRLRPRVSLLNWRYLEPTEREKDPPVNYRQLERGAAIYPRMRRVAVAPQRFRNEYVMSHKYKDTFRRERRVPTSTLKFIRKSPMKRDTHSKIFRSNFGVRSNASSAQGTMNKESLPQKIKKCKPCIVAIDPLNKIEETKVRENSVTGDGQNKLKIQPFLNVPSLVQILIEDGQVLLMGYDYMCFFAWTLHSKHPRAVIYQGIEGDMMPIPWLYVPIPSLGEAWIFHQVSDSISQTPFVYIPEINCAIHSKALEVQFNKVATLKKGMNMKIQWVGEDTQKRVGSIYIFPELPGVLVCGPFPKSQLKVRTGPNSGKARNANNICSFVDKTTSKRYMGDHISWNAVFSNSREQRYKALINKVIEDEIDQNIKEPEIPNKVFFDMMPKNYKQSFDGNKSQLKNFHKPEELKISWKEAASFLSVRPSVS